MNLSSNTSGACMRFMISIMLHNSIVLQSTLSWGDCLPAMSITVFLYLFFSPNNDENFFLILSRSKE